MTIRIFKKKDGTEVLQRALYCYVSKAGYTTASDTPITSLGGDIVSSRIEWENVPIVEEE